MAISMDEHRLREMMRRQQVDVLEFRYDGAGATFEIARRACAHCDSVEVCLTWLGSDTSEMAPEFCPNRRLFEQFRLELDLPERD
jgi:hypothetical protein